ncbi:MAG: exodeoxyribonuclease V subunit alpha [Pseudomonadales bacterium]|nr:exodeoxyribonuclease V subunit alpha [Pseudomonadales bacterium]
MSDEGLDIRPLDAHFGRALARWSEGALAGAEHRLVERLGTRLSAELGRQNVCLELTALAAEGDWTAPAELRGVLDRAGLLAGAEPAPLVLDGDRLYLARFHDYEARLAAALLDRARDSLLEEGEIVSLAPRLAALFPGGEAPDWQRVAAATALDRRLAVIAGGPGTGKTTTVARLLVLLLECAGAGGAPKIRLAAPTGKAAARLTESLREARTALEATGATTPEVLAALPGSASTLHRLLGFRSPENRFVHGPSAPLAVDVVVVDEASMIDLRLMAQLVSALPREARLVLLGDPDQLSSVEAGRVLGDLCAWTETQVDAARFTRAGAARLSRLVGTDLTSMAGDAVPPLADALCRLRRSHRFDAGGELGRFARAVNEGDAARARALLAAEGRGLRALRDTKALVEEAVTGYEEAVRIARDGTPEQALAAFARFQVLCASRRGRLGVERMNVTVEQALRRRGLLEGGDRQYAGRPVMVTVNDYGLGLFNGDVGVVLHDARGVARAWFMAPDRTVRSVRAARLPAHETAFAMTVHKSQGSEFDRVLVALGDDEPRLLTRELLYTAVTRARSEALVHATDAALERAVRTRSERRSGLRARLWPRT